MAQADDIAFLFDVDNALLDNDRVQEHLSEHLAENYGVAARDRYFEPDWLIDYPFVERLYAGALDAKNVCGNGGPTVIRRRRSIPAPQKSSAPACGASVTIESSSTFIKSASLHTRASVFRRSLRAHRGQIAYPDRREENLG